MLSIQRKNYGVYVSRFGRLRVENFHSIDVKNKYNENNYNIAFII